MEPMIFGSLADLRPGEWGYIQALDMEHDLTKRLGDFGIADGTSVHCERVGFLGDPAAYRFCGVLDDMAASRNNGTIIALRKKDAEQICIRRPMRQAASGKDGGTWD